MKTRPMGILLIMLAGWINRHQQDAIEYLKAKNKILLDKLGKKRIILNDEQGMYLAVLGRKLGRKVLSGKLAFAYTHAPCVDDANAMAMLFAFYEALCFYGDITPNTNENDPIE
jgi:hypothetical protein